MALENDFMNFLTTDPGFKAMNFRFLAYKIYPDGYTRDVADCIRSGKIKISQRFSDIGYTGTAASYLPESDRYSVSASFKLTTAYNKIAIAHESTHALQDYQRLGPVLVPEAEAVAYVAEAIFIRASGLMPIVDLATGVPDPIRTAADNAAAAVLSGSYNVPPPLAASVVMAVKLSRHYGQNATKFLNFQGIN